jgi:hypothetical protein
MGSGSNQRCCDLRFQVFSKRDWQFDVCPSAVAICDGQHNRAMVCCSGANVAHSPISRCCIRGHGAIVSARLQRVAASLIMPIASWVRIDFIRLPRILLRYSDSPAVDSQHGSCFGVAASFRQSGGPLLEIPRSRPEMGAKLCDPA